MWRSSWRRGSCPDHALGRGQDQDHVGQGGYRGGPSGHPRDLEDSGSGVWSPRIVCWSHATCYLDICGWSCLLWCLREVQVIARHFMINSVYNHYNLGCGCVDVIVMWFKFLILHSNIFRLNNCISICQQCIFQSVWWAKLLGLKDLWLGARPPYFHINMRVNVNW